MCRRSDVFGCCLSVELLRMVHQIRVNVISLEDRREGTWWSTLQRNISICDLLQAELSKQSVPLTIPIASHDWLVVSNIKWPNKIFTSNRSCFFLHKCWYFTIFFCLVVFKYFFFFTYKPKTEDYKDQFFFHFRNSNTNSQLLASLE